MSKKQVMNLIDNLARSQGFYGRLGRSIREAEANGVDTTEWFEQFADCKEGIDVIMMIEG